MQPRILITNGGPHSAETWANLTASMILPIDDPRNPPLDPARRPAALRLQAAIAEALAPHKHNVQQSCRLALETYDHNELGCEHDHHNDHMFDVMAAIQVAAKGTPWEEHFARQEVVNTIQQVVESHMVEIQKIERSWYCDRVVDKDHPEVVAYRSFLGQET